MAERASGWLEPSSIDAAPVPPFPDLSAALPSIPAPRLRCRDAASLPPNGQQPMKLLSGRREHGTADRESLLQGDEVR